MFFVMVISFCHGLQDIASLGTFMYQKEQIGLQPETITLIGGLIGFPWCIKPIFGYSVDSLVLKVSKTKYIVFVTALIRFVSFSIMGHLNVGTYMFYALLFINCISYLLENIISEYILVCMTKEQNSSEGGVNNQLPIYFGFRAAGSFIGGFSGGRIIHAYSNQAAFICASFIPLIIVVETMLYREANRSEGTHNRTFDEEFTIMKRLLFRDKVLQLILFICLINLTPNFDALYTFYMTDFLKFSTEDLANFSAFATFCYIIGLLVYYYFMKNVNPQNFYITTNFILWFINLSFLLVVLNYLTSWGVNIKMFCLLSQGAGTLIGELNFMPILAIWCALCPNNLEGTSITLFTGLLNLSGNASLYFGSFLIWLMDIHKEDYDRMWIPVVVQNSYLLIMIVAILFIKFPDPSKIEDVAIQMDEDEERSQIMENEEPGRVEEDKDKTPQVSS